MCEHWIWLAFVEKYSLYTDKKQRQWIGMNIETITLSTQIHKDIRWMFINNWLLFRRSLFIFMYQSRRVRFRKEFYVLSVFTTKVRSQECSHIWAGTSASVCESMKGIRQLLSPCSTELIFEHDSITLLISTHAIIEYLSNQIFLLSSCET